LGFGHSVGTVPITPKGAFFKYYSIAFSILPSIAGGLALDLVFDLRRQPLLKNVAL